MRHEVRHRRRWALGLVLSLLVHALLVLWLWATPERAPARLVRRQQPVVVEVVRLPAPVAPVTPPAPAPAKTHRKRVPAPAAEVAPSTPQPSEAVASALGGARAAGGGGGALPGDAPRGGLILLPGAGFSVGPVGPPDEPRGRTVRNGPGEQVPAEALADYQCERATRKVNELLGRASGTGNVAVGLVDPWFGKALRTMRDQGAANPPPRQKKTAAQQAGEVVDAWLTPAARFGATGSPLAAGDTGADLGAMNLAQPDKANAILRDTAWANSMQGAQQMLVAPDIMLKQYSRTRFETIIELEQVPGGAVANATVVKSSGFRDFDEYALHRARKVFVLLDDAPDAGFGIDARGWRTVWRFRLGPPGVTVDLLRIDHGRRANPFEHAPE